jgi:nucleoside-diphosphate-sugar epimerase
LITGASGYIGRRLVEVAHARGIGVVVLGSAPPVEGIERAFVWRLGEPPPARAFDGVAAVIHLAHAWSEDARQPALSENVNLLGSEALASAALAAGVSRIVFASSVSARPAALNAYGRTKHAVEGRLLALPGMGDRLACARIGLVYGGREVGQYGLMCRLVRLTPVLPMIGVDREIQPLHLDEVCAGLLASSTALLPPRAGNSPATYVLAGAQPVTFGTWLKILRRAQTGKSLALVPVPLWVALLACDLTGLLPFVPRVDRERVLGLAGTAPMDSAPDLAALGITVADPVERLGLLRFERRRILAEAAAMLAYLGGRRACAGSAIAHLVRGIERDGARPLALPRLVLRCPPLLRAFEPLRPRPGHRLADRLHLAAMVHETMPDACARRSPGLLSLAGQLAMEAVALPFRLVLGGRYK